MPAISSANLLDVENLITSIPSPEGEIRLVDSVSFTVTTGEILALVGESGSGKTLTAMSIMGLLPGKRLRMRGSIRFDGRELVGLPEKAMRRIRGKDIALIPQDPMTALNPTLSVGHQLVETLRLHSDLTRAQARRRAIELLEMVQIPHASRRVDDYQHEFSGGMRQRVMIALALSCNPKLIVADEATSALDVTTQAQIVALLRELCTSVGASMIFITHDLGLVATMCDRVNVMYSGRIVESAGVRALFERQYSPYSQRLISAVPSAAQPRKSMLLTIEGHTPSARSGQIGCRFASRCAHTRAACVEAEPLLRERAADRRARCWATEPEGWLA